MSPAGFISQAEQKNSTISHTTKVSPTSCRSYVVLAQQRQDQIGLRENCDQQKISKTFESPYQDDCAYKICCSEHPRESLPPVDTSAYSIKPFNQVNQNKMDKVSFRTPEALPSYSNLDDSKTNFQSMKCQRKQPACAFLWKPDTSLSQHAKLSSGAGVQDRPSTGAEEPRKALFTQPFSTGDFVNDENCNKQLLAL